MGFHKSLFSLVFIAGFAVPVQADLPLGLWQATPDQRGVVMHVRTKPCGKALCGQVERAKNTKGFDTPSESVGSKVLWDMIPQPDGSYLGALFSPDSGQVRTTRLRVNGNRMQLDSCAANSCSAQIWNRLR